MVLRFASPATKHRIAHDQELLVIRAMRLRPKYRRRYEEALEWRVTP